MPHCASLRVNTVRNPAGTFRWRAIDRERSGRKSSSHPPLSASAARKPQTPFTVAQKLLPSPTGASRTLNQGQRSARRQRRAATEKKGGDVAYTWPTLAGSDAARARPSPDWGYRRLQRRMRREPRSSTSGARTRCSFVPPFDQRGFRVQLQRAGQPWFGCNLTTSCSIGADRGHRLQLHRQITLVLLRARYSHCVSTTRQL